jgi:hypothetical protein
MRVSFGDLRFEQVAEWYRPVGVVPSARHASLACRLADAGVEVAMCHDREVRAMDDVARVLTSGEPDAVVVSGGGDAPARLAARLPVPVVTTVGPTADRAAAGQPAAVFDGDEDGVVAALAAALGGSAPAGARPPAQAGPAQARGPFARRILPASAAAAAGIEVAFPGPDGRLHEHPAERVAGELAAVDRRRNDGAPVDLVGAGLGDAERIGARLASLAARGASPRYVRPGLTVDAECARPELVAAAGRAGVRDLRIVVADAAVPDWPDLQAAFAEAGAAGIDAGLSLRVGREDVDVRAVEALGRFAAERGARLDWTAVPGLSRDAVDAVDAALHLAPQTRRRRELAGTAAFARVVAGRYPPEAARPVDLLVTAEAAGVVGPATAASLDLVGLDTVVLHPAAGTDAGGPGTPAGLRDVLGLEPGLTGLVAVGGDIPVEILDYAAGRDVEPFGPTLLRLRTRDDVTAFLADADHARATGAFPTGLLDPATRLADTCAWRDTPCPSRRLPRLVLDIDVDAAMRPVLRTAPGGPAVAPAGISPAQLRAAVGRRAAAEADRRGCSTCPVRASCSMDDCLSAVLDSADYCAARRARPWLPGYLHALDALTLLAGERHAEAAEPAGAGTGVEPGGGPAPRVSGFGGRLVVAGAAGQAGDLDETGEAGTAGDAGGVQAPPASAGPVLVLVLRPPSRFLLVDPATGRRAAVGRDTAGIAEATQAGGEEAAVAWLTRQRGVPPPEAARVVPAVLADLAARGLSPLGARNRPARSA